MKIAPIVLANSNQQNHSKNDASFGLRLIINAEGKNSLSNIMKTKKASEEVRKLALDDVILTTLNLSPAKLEKMVAKRMKLLWFDKNLTPKDVIPDIQTRTAELSFFEKIKDRYTEPKKILNTVVKDSEYNGVDSFVQPEHADAPLHHFMPKFPFNRPSTVETSIKKALLNYIDSMLSGAREQQRLLQRQKAS